MATRVGAAGAAPVAQRSNGTTGVGAGAARICQFKLVLLGESAVGKSSLVLRFVKGQFHEFQESTIGGEILSPHCNETSTLCNLPVLLQC